MIKPRFQLAFELVKKLNQTFQTPSHVSQVLLTVEFYRGFWQIIF